MTAQQETTESISPIGASVTDDIHRRGAQDPAFRARWEAGTEFREVAWLLIKYRMDHELTQQELADRVGTSSTHIARIESGRHRTSLTTLLRIAHALNLKGPSKDKRPNSSPNPHLKRAGN